MAEKTQLSLADLINAKLKLNHQEIEEVARLVGGWEKTKHQVKITLSYVPNIRPWGIYQRLIIRPRVHYIPGQSYSDEIRTLRECLRG